MMNENETATDAADDDETAELSVLEGDIRSQMKRLRGIADRGDATLELVVRELYGTVLPLMLDHVRFTDRLEEHAEWASGEIDALTTGEGGSSRLTPEDGEAYRQYITAVMSVCENSMAHAEAGSEQAALLQTLLDRSRELLAVTNDLTMDDSDDGGDDDTEPAPPDPVLELASGKANGQA